MKPWEIAFVLLPVAIALMIAVAWHEVRHGFSARPKPSAIVGPTERVSEI